MLDFKIKHDPKTNKEWMETSLSGKPLLTTPQLNKGTAFTKEERKLFGLTGKLPIIIENIDQQVDRVYLQYQSFGTPLQKNVFLNKLHDTNQMLFYKLMQNHEAEMIPIVYTPTVGTAIEKFSREFYQVRGLYIAYEHRYEIEEILDNRSNPEIDVVVVSDGGGVLGIGDQGVGAMLIPVAKLMVYTICGGISPYRTLPILLDVGTDNQILLNDPFYLGWRHPRITGDDYDEFISLFVQAIKRKLPNIFLHWEDFGRDNARRILHQYRNQLCTFNDDIQGTGAVTLAALMAGVKNLHSDLSKQRIVIFGGGSAGTGIADQLFDALCRFGLTDTDARSHFWIIDRAGLLFDDLTDLTSGQKTYARKRTEIESWQVPDRNQITLLDVVKHIKPTVLIGCSSAKGAFTREVIQEMHKHAAQPIIFALSNPTEKAEAVPTDLLEWTDGQALVATGTLFSGITYKGQPVHIAQCNNALVFPGIGLGIIAIQATQLTDNMLWAACIALSECAPIHKNPKASLLPPIEKAQPTARHIAIAVAKQALADGVAKIKKEQTVEALVDANMWHPEYLTLRKKAAEVNIELC